MAKILLVEDDPNLGMILQESLQRKGLTVTLCDNGDQALQVFIKGQFDLCILDVMMPKKDGFTLGREIKNINPEMPLIFATAKSMMQDKAEGFNLGADDYITKPFNTDELLLRINAVLKRAGNNDTKLTEQTQFHIGDYVFDYQLQTLNLNGATSRVTTKEAELLRLLCLNVNKVLLRETALIQIWNDDSYFNGRSMDVFLTKLRKYLKDDPNVEIINVHGKGYKLVIQNGQE